ncbi:hypothetical protein ABIE26_005340 [Pedobacter africanus]|uniref:Uncharacterized protein n=1 Tax=Pedobacter africanus TaxID=151894 RepID=A0ACC6L4Z2_9SPHI|nr:RagB/SusD family nutrient uptake outer membrane protein [Pedobacter africanus]MDR6786473.1 hypothetical protein [Pedobacter africanus]
MKNHISIAILALTTLSCITACKEEFLEVKQNQSLVIPATIADYQGLMDNKTIMNNNACSELAIIGSDEYSVSDAVWAALPNPYQKNGYIWAKDVYEGNALEEWNNAYWRILYANTAADGAANIKPAAAQQAEYNNLKGSAMFHRAFNFYQLAQVFCKPYNVATAPSDPGIPIRLEADINLPSKRGTVAQTYGQIIKDLTTAAELLPQPALFKSRPSKAAAYAMLAKTFLMMGDYGKAADYASQSLSLHSTLNDLNTFNLSNRFTFPTDAELNPEILFATGISGIAILTVTRINIPASLVNSYQSTDLRKQAYFFNNTDGRILPKGSYKGATTCFTGLATDEVWLILAESLARTGQVPKAMETLNTLRKTRYNKTGYADLITTDATTALNHILTERKKELLLRGTRWEDLRRLNKEPDYATTLTRIVNGTTYTLPPNDSRYTWPIPDNEIALSNFQQNPR